MDDLLSNSGGEEGWRNDNTTYHSPSLSLSLPPLHISVAVARKREKTFVPGAAGGSGNLLGANMQRLVSVSVGGLPGLRTCTLTPQVRPLKAV